VQTKKYTLTINVTNPEYGNYAVKRNGTALSSGAAIYHFDKLTAESSGKGAGSGSWNITSVAAPSATTSGAATTGNLTIKNEDGNTATLYYNASNAAGGTSAGSTASGGTKYVDNLSFNTTYYISAGRTRSKST
jgi:hypothetical protein